MKLHDLFFVIVCISICTTGFCSCPIITDVKSNDVYSYSNDIFNETMYESSYNRFIEPLELIKQTNCSSVTLYELYNFVLNDNTDKGSYTLGIYDCTQFSQDLVNNATENGYEAYFVYVLTDDNKAHAVSVFNTSDMGYVFVDNTPSQDDTKYSRSADYFTKIEFGEEIISYNIENNVTALYSNMGKIKKLTKVIPE